MSDESTQTRRTPPLLVPTLTDVVHATAGGSPRQAAIDFSDITSPSALTESALVDLVVTRVDALLEQRLRELLAAQVLTQSGEVLLAIRQELPTQVRQILREIWAAQSAAALPPQPAER